jgi:hypothetical protein
LQRFSGIGLRHERVFQEVEMLSGAACRVRGNKKAEQKMIAALAFIYRVLRKLIYQIVA